MGANNHDTEASLNPWTISVGYELILKDIISCYKETMG
jgi:hypothetical protein